MDNKTSFFIIFLLIILSIIWKPILIFIIPGILVLFLPIFKKIDLIDLIIYIIGISMVFWICSFWFLKFINLSLTNFFLLITIITLLIIIYFLFKKPKPYKISFKFHNFILIFLFLFVLILRLLPINSSITSVGADMSKNIYITNLIANANGVPDNYYPILGIDKFFSHPVGFHTISALISLIGDIPGYRGAFIVSSLSYVFITLFLFIFLRKYVSWEFAIISSISFTFFTIHPQGFVSWGGNPTIFTLALFILFVSFLEKIKNNNQWLIILSALSLASVFLSHTMIFIQAFYTFGIAYFIYFLLKKEYKNYKWIKYVKIILLFFIIIIPFLINLNYYDIVTPETTNYFKNFKMSKPVFDSITIHNFIWTTPFYIGYIVFGKPDLFSFISIFLIIIGIIYLFAKNLRAGITYIIFLLLCALTLLGLKYWILPFSYALDPHRIAVMTIIPFSLFFAVGLKSLLSYLHSNKILNKKILYLILFLLLLLTIIMVPKYNKEKYTNNILYYNSVTEDDFKAFYWLKAHTNETDVIENNYGDGGLWIPSIISRPITAVHPPLPYIKMESLGEPKYVYIGRKCVYQYACGLKNSDFINNNKYELIYSEDEVYIYKIIL